MREKDKNKIESSEIRFLRRLQLQGLSLRDRVRTADIRNEPDLESSIVEEIVQYQNNWKEHANRMSSDRLPKQALFYNPKGKTEYWQLKLTDVFWRNKMKLTRVG